MQIARARFLCVSGTPPTAYTPPLRERFTDAERAELFLTHYRATFAPHGAAFRRLVEGINNPTSTASKEVANCLKVFDARPKYVLRKLTFSILPASAR